MSDQLLGQVRAIWADVLDRDVDEVPVDTNFLEAGGNSLLLVMLWEELTGATGATIKLSDLFRHATVRAQVALLSGAAEPQTVPGAQNRGRLLGRASAGAE
ncbi:acyl carrier protein [Saccharothrix sp. ALI-22-I]|uniref:acyl carrier protein n=1 Tax=Saccharothrix sp. ALI-22-I TaxID=1933778 RepID=UPI00117B2CD7|nr:acyl carrier protein [Saccharothrix sp. ALI-22-I]